MSDTFSDYNNVESQDIHEEDSGDHLELATKLNGLYNKLSVMSGMSSVGISKGIEVIRESPDEFNESSRATEKSAMEKYS